MSLSDAISDYRNHGYRQTDKYEPFGGLILPVEARTRTDSVLIDHTAVTLTATVDGLELDGLAGVELVHDYGPAFRGMGDPFPPRRMYVGLWVAANYDGTVQIMRGTA